MALNFILLCVLLIFISIIYFKTMSEESSAIRFAIGTSIFDFAFRDRQGGSSLDMLVTYPVISARTQLIYKKREEDPARQA